jgi:hypothetical protein
MATAHPLPEQERQALNASRLCRHATLVISALNFQQDGKVVDALQAGHWYDGSPPFIMRMVTS